MKGNFRRRRKDCLFVTVALICLIACFSNSEAIEIVQIDQAKVRLSVPPGQSKTGAIKVNNYSAEAKHIKVYAQDWVYLPACDGTKDFKPAGTTPLSAANWITFLPSEFSISAYGRQTLNYTVKVSPDAQGGHYAVLFFEGSVGEEKEESLSEGVTVSLAVRIASLFYIETEGTINLQAKIEDFKVDKKEDKFYIAAKFTNTGNVDITTQGTFFIIDQNGIVYARGEFNDIYAFPQDTATLTSSWKEPLPKGKYDLVLTIDTGKAREAANLGRGPVITKEAEIEIGEQGQLLKVGELR